MLTFSLWPYASSKEQAREPTGQARKLISQPCPTKEQAPEIKTQAPNPTKQAPIVTRQPWEMKTQAPKVKEQARKMKRQAPIVAGQAREVISQVWEVISRVSKATLLACNRGNQPIWGKLKPAILAQPVPFPNSSPIRIIRVHSRTTLPPLIMIILII